MENNTEPQAISPENTKKIADAIRNMQADGVPDDRIKTTIQTYKESLVKKKDQPSENLESPSTSVQGGSSLESQPLQSIEKINQEAFGDYILEAVQSGKITEEQAFLKPSEIFKIAASYDGGIESKLPSSFEELDNTPKYEWGVADFKTLNESELDAAEVSRDAENKVVAETNKVTQKVRDKVLAQIPEDQRTPEGIAKLEQELLDQGVRLNLNPEESGVMGEDQGFLYDAVNSLQSGITNAVTTAATMLEQDYAKSIGYEALRKTELERLSKKITQYDGDVFDSLGKGNFSEAAKLSLNQFGESLPMMAIAAASKNPYIAYTGIATLSSGQRYLDVKNEKWFSDLSEGGKTAYLSVYGGAEAFGEMIGGRVLKRSMTNLLSKNEAFSGNAIKYLTDFFGTQAKMAGKNFAEEGVAEGVTGVTQYVADAMAKGEEITMEGANDAFARSAVSGIGMATVTTGSSVTGKTAMTFLEIAMTPDVKLANKKANEIKEAMKKSSSPDETSVLADKLEEIESIKSLNTKLV